jgi:translation initiation factor IF-3
VIAEDGAQLGILPTDEALRRAEDLGLDLVEVSPTARPPVCKIMDYGKFKYEQKRRASEQKKKQHQIEVKEVKFRPKTDKHDFDVKVKRLRKFIGQGNKSKVTIMFRGREIVHPEIGHQILANVAEQIADIAAVESQARMEGRQMFMIVAPVKSGKKPAKAEDTAEKSVRDRPPVKSGPEITRTKTVAKPPAEKAAD